MNDFVLAAITIASCGGILFVVHTLLAEREEHAASRSLSEDLRKSYLLVIDQLTDQMLAATKRAGEAERTLERGIQRIIEASTRSAEADLKLAIGTIPKKPKKRSPPKRKRR